MLKITFLEVLAVRRLLNCLVGQSVNFPKVSLRTLHNDIFIVHRSHRYSLSHPLAMSISILTNNTNNVHDLVVDAGARLKEHPKFNEVLKGFCLLCPQNKVYIVQTLIYSGMSF